MLYDKHQVTGSLLLDFQLKSRYLSFYKSSLAQNLKQVIVLTRFNTRYQLSNCMLKIALLDLLGKIDHHHGIQVKHKRDILGHDATPGWSRIIAQCMC